MLLALLLACSRTVPTGPDVVVISLDTMRADALSCYAEGGRTPALDALAARGVRFAWALAHAPTTLNSHASVWTGTDPHGHGVPRNGFTLPDALDTFPERLRDAGWDTVGVVGASVLGKETGISRGFRVWDEEVALDRGRRTEARAGAVTDRALIAARGRDPDRPLLLFVHYFDAHAPYDAPGRWARAFGDPAYAGPVDGSQAAMQRLSEQVRAGRADPRDVEEVLARYRGEAAYVDAEVGRLLASLPLRDPVVVVFGDHGESLGEDRINPYGHGGDVDLRAIHVPLLVAGPGVPEGAVVERVARLMDVGPTVLGLAGLPSRLGDGQDLALGWRGLKGAAPDHFAEATQPADRAATEGWPNAPFERAVVRGDRMLVRAPLTRAPSRLYHLDAAQTPVWDEPGGVAALEAALDAWDARPPAKTAAAIDDEGVREGLRALGYEE